MAVKPKLCVIPSGVGTDTLYSVLPTDGTGDFTFDRNLNTATRINKDGLIEMVDADVPRLNYPLIEGVVSGCPSLLLEPQRTNLIQYSEDFSQSYWIKTGSSITSNSVISPDGTLNAFKISEDLSNGTHRFYKTALSDGAAANKEFTYSIFLKKAEIKWFLLKTVINSQSVTVDVWFDLENGVIGTESNGSGKIENYGNDWYRCSINIVTNASATSLNIYGYLAEGNNSYSYQGDGTSGVYIYGAMLEQGSYPTSYIPNYGTAAGVTRSAETCNNAGDANTFNDSEGVLMAEISAFSNLGNLGQISLSDGTFDNVVRIGYRAELNRLDCRVRSGGADQFISVPTISDVKSYNKIALYYKLNEFKLLVNGVQVGSTDASGNIPTGLNTLYFSDANGILNPFYGNTKQIQYFDTALTDTDLEELTSWTSFNEMAESQLYSIQ